MLFSLAYLVVDVLASILPFLFKKKNLSYPVKLYFSCMNHLTLPAINVYAVIKKKLKGLATPLLNHYFIFLVPEKIDCLDEVHDGKYHYHVLKRSQKECVKIYSSEQGQLMVHRSIHTGSDIVIF